uniref:Aquaporin n=1 Tax=Scolopendra viridis TaxID=118503 RepID=A0A4D5RB59_SCOVI
MFAWLVHLGDLAIITFTCHLLRVVVRKLLPDTPRILLEELISTADFCGCCFEMAFLFEVYGTIPFGIALFIMCLWWCYIWGDAAVNPNKHLEDYIKGEASVLQAGLRILFEMVAGIYTFWFIHYMWSFGLSVEHKYKSREKICDADLQVSPMKGALVEGILTFIDRFNALVAGDIAPLQSVVYSAGLSTGLVLAGLNYSGGYFNPVLATSLKYGCRGHNVLEFFLVYWIGSVTGCLVALYLYMFVVSRFTKKRAPVEAEEKKVN